MKTKEKIFFWTTTALILIVAGVSAFFSLRKATTPPKDNGVELTNMTDALKNPTAAFRLNLRHEAGTTTLTTAGPVTMGTSTQLTAIPASLFSLVNLDWLNLSGNALTSIPPEIGNLKNLQTIYLGNNQLTSIPDAICSLPKLVGLSLFQNNITSLPSCLSGIKSLKMIGLTGNPIPTSTIIELRKEMPSSTIYF
jgi:hypothetical protein